MASIGQLISELAHAVKQPNNTALRENLRLLIIQTRNELIRRSYENHGYVDKFFTQRFRVSLTDVNDGDINFDNDNVEVDKIKRTLQKVPRPVRLTNNLPFDRVSSAGYKTNREFPYIKETSARFSSAVPGLCGIPRYDYINEYIYLFPAEDKSLDFNSIVIEGAFENPTEIQINNGDISEEDAFLDENEYILSEDMIGSIKDIIYKRDLLDSIRETNEIENNSKFR